MLYEVITKLMGINLLKRLESSVHSFKLTICRVKDLIESTIRTRITSYNVCYTKLLRTRGNQTVLDAHSIVYQVE